MRYSNHFVCASECYNTLEHPVANPQFRKSFLLPTLPSSAQLTICGLGYYEVYLNGQNITKGYMAPYRANPDHYLYYDHYELGEYLTEGENVLGILLGNGFLNSCASTWDFDKAPFRSSPKVALSLVCDGAELFDARALKWTESPIWFEEFHSGEYYDARREILGWKSAGFDDSAWRDVLPATCPAGQPRIPACEPIGIVDVHYPVKITKSKNGYIYDFVVNAAGLCELKLKGSAGQEVTLRYGEILREGELDMTNISYHSLTQTDKYILSGKGTETFMPHFTYHGFRFVEVGGISEEQATPELLTFYEMSSSFARSGDFSCDNAPINALFDAAIQSDRANFLYLPTDCPHREKNGWTGDAALSADQFLTYFDCSRSLEEWLRNIFKAQNQEGAIPGIVPTYDWGFAWGNGPAWDNVMFELPYRIWQHTGRTDIIHEGLPFMVKYLHYMETKRDEKGLLHYGLGDWCHVQRVKDSSYLTYTDTMICKDICDKAALMFALIDANEEANYAAALSADIKTAFRSHCMRISSHSSRPALRIQNQTTQAMAIFYGMFEEDEKAFAEQELEYMIRSHTEHMDVGVLGNRVIFHVLAQYGAMDLALDMMLNPTFPSFKYWLDQGATALFENFYITKNPIDRLTDEDPRPDSLNHNFWGDIIAVFMRHLAGIQIHTPGRVTIAPCFTKHMSRVSAHKELAEGKISVQYKKTGDLIDMTAILPAGIEATLKIPQGYRLCHGKASCKTGENHWLFCKE